MEDKNRASGKIIYEESVHSVESKDHGAQRGASDSRQGGIRRAGEENTPGAEYRNGARQSGRPFDEALQGSSGSTSDKTLTGRQANFYRRPAPRREGAIGRFFRGIWRVLKYLWREFRKYISPAFLVILGLSLLLWYSFELQDNYTTKIPIRFDIEGTQLRTEVVIHGTGYKILKQRRGSRREIHLEWSDLKNSVKPSDSNPEAVVIAPKALQAVIAELYPEMEIDSMASVPEVVRLPVEEKKE